MSEPRGRAPLARTLLIVESPKKARTIAGYLGQSYRVEASFGHIRDLPQRELGIDVENGFRPTYVLVPRAATRLKALREAIASASQVLLATDPDREGEAIAWHLGQSLGLPLAARNRVAFHEITPGAIRAALASPRSLDLALVEAQQARRLLDRLVGYGVSPLLWRKVQRGTSAGRVQSVALRLIVEREEEIEAFVPKEYWKLLVTLSPESAPKERFQAALTEYDGKEIRKVPIPDEKTAEEVARWLSAAETRYSVRSTEKKARLKSPPPPFTTSTLQQAAANRLRLGGKQTMALAQSLYEAGLITYHRTDSTQVSPEAIDAARKVIGERFGPEYLPANPRHFASRQKNAQEAHEAIRPTSPERQPDSLSVSAGEARLYELILQRFLASQMADARYLDDRAIIDAVNPLHRATLIAQASALVFPGYLAVYGFDRQSDAQTSSPSRKPTGRNTRSGAGAASDENDQPEQEHLPNLRQGEGLIQRGVEKRQHFTRPPARYTEATIVETLEKLGIGRPSTYASIIETILKRGYVVLSADSLPASQTEAVEGGAKKGIGRGGARKVFAPTPLGRAVDSFLREHFAEVVATEFTARMEEGLDEVASGAVAWRDLLGRFYAPLSQAMERAKSAENSSGSFERPTRSSPRRSAKPPRARSAPKETTGEDCPKCGKPLVQRTQRATGKPFFGCSGFPSCRYTRDAGPELSPAPGPAPKSSPPTRATRTRATPRKGPAPLATTSNTAPDLDGGLFD